MSGKIEIEILGTFFQPGTGETFYDVLQRTCHKYVPFVCIEKDGIIKISFFHNNIAFDWSTIRGITDLNAKDAFIDAGKIYPRRIRSGLRNPVIWIEEKTLMQNGYSNVQASIINWGDDIIEAIENYCLPVAEDNLS